MPRQTQTRSFREKWVVQQLFLLLVCFCPLEPSLWLPYYLLPQQQGGWICSVYHPFPVSTSRMQREIPFPASPALAKYQTPSLVSLALAKHRTPSLTSPAIAKHRTPSLASPAHAKQRTPSLSSDKVKWYLSLSGLILDCSHQFKLSNLRDPVSLLIGWTSLRRR